jgi:hypothetical protein
LALLAGRFVARFVPRFGVRFLLAAGFRRRGFGAVFRAAGFRRRVGFFVGGTSRTVPLGSRYSTAPSRVIVTVPPPGTRNGFPRFSTFRFLAFGRFAISLFPCHHEQQGAADHD